jgi:hypothetical protein
MKIHESELAEAQSPVPNENLRVAVLKQLMRIQNSPAFCNSPRSVEFLSYVVENTLEEHTEILKERTIGVNLFHRSSDYVTSDDAIVRVKAAEVRKRLHQYYAEEEQAPAVRIELPVGSYIPKFHLPTSPDATPPQVKSPVIEQITPRTKRLGWKIAALAAAVVIIGIVVASTMRRHVQQKSQLDEFWAPVFATQQPVLICISSPVLYYPDLDLYAKANRSHPGLYDSEVKRAINPLQLDPNTALKWKEIEPRPDIFVSKVHVYNVALLSALFERIHKTSQVKVGSDLSYNDLQNSPAVLLGAFDNSWSVRMTAELPFYFQDRDGTIVERGGQGRIWQAGPNQTLNTKDFAIVARLLNSRSGQFQVILGGINIAGTEAVGKLVTRQADLDVAFRSVPSGWQNKNLEFVIETDVIDSADSSTHVVAVKTW